MNCFTWKFINLDKKKIAIGIFENLNSHDHYNLLSPNFEHFATLIKSILNLKMEFVFVSNLESFNNEWISEKIKSINSYESIYVDESSWLFLPSRFKKIAFNKDEFDSGIVSFSWVNKHLNSFL